jgi:guanylate kinase
MKYKILAFIGEAGAGKDSIANAVLGTVPNLHKVISCTTRPPREGEKNGVDYHFLSPPQFRSDIANGKFAESTKFNNWFYGTRFEDLSRAQINVGVFNPAGIRNLLKIKDIDLRVVRITTSTEERKRRYLMRDSAADINELERRITADERDFSYLDFNYVTLTNETKEDFDLAIKKVERWVSLWRNSEGQK